MISRSGAQVVIDALEEAGVDTVFGYPGGTIMPVYDALLDSSIRHILTRHEQSAIHAADGLARSTGRLGVCLATSGPGATNLTTGICTAQLDSSPILCITGQVVSGLIGTDGFQEADVPGFVAAITKQVYQVRNVDELPEVMAEAIFVARSGRPGPVVVDIAKDAQVATTTATCSPVKDIKGYEHSPKFDHADLRRAHELLKEAKKPVCIVGGGCRLAQATGVFRHWYEKAELPVVTTLMGIGSVEPGYEGLLGMPGMHGLRRANIALTECDLMIALGIRFDDRVTGKISKFAQNSRIIHVDIDVAELGKLVPVDARVHGDLREVLTAWLALLESDPLKSKATWRADAMAVGDGLDTDTSAHADGVPPTGLLDMVLATAGPDAIVATDVGQNQMWTAQRVRPSDPTKFITSGGAGTMGFGLPSGIGAQFGNPDQKVLVVAGDGGFQMTMVELATVRRCKLPLKILVMDNKYLGMVRQWQELFCDNRYSGVDLSDNPDFAALARVYNIEAFTLKSAQAMRSTIDAWWNCPGPALLHAECHLEQNVFPMVPAGAGLADMMEKA